MAQVHQALHGYRRGHRLLASSLELPHEAQRLMTIASDLSGPGRTKGFESYLTGYPLASEGLYVLARTWYAKDAPRPGCVWTHSLLIRTADLARIPSLKLLVGLFVEPNVDELAPYRRPVELPKVVSRFPGRLSSAEDQRVALKILKGLYCQPEKAVILPAKSSSSVEAAVVEVWSQQWPRLRRAFTFSSGSLADRRQTTGMRFDIQVVPADRLQRILRAHADNATVSQECADEHSDAIDFLFADLLVPNQLFRDYLQSAGADVADCRRAAILLTWLHQAVTSGQSLVQIMEEVTAKFPSGSATQLRRMLLGPTDVNSRWGANIAEQERLEYLATCSTPDDYQVEALELVERGRALLASDRTTARALTSRLFSGNLNPRGAALLGGFAEAWSLDDIVDLEQHSPGAAASIVHASPMVATSAGFWKRIGGSREDLVDAISSSPALSDHVAGQVLRAVLQSDAPLPESMVARGGLPFVRALLEVAEGDSPIKRLDKVIPGAWIRGFGPHVRAVFEWVGERPKRMTQPQLWLIASGFSAHPAQFALLSAGQWQTVLPRSLDDISGAAGRDVSTFLFHVGMVSTRDVALELLQLSFPILHRSLKRSKLSSDDWYRLSSALPPAREWRGWDHAERLRRALVRRVMSAPSLSAMDLVVICNDPSLLGDVLEDARLDEETRPIVEELASAPKAHLDKRTRSSIERVTKKLKRRTSWGWF